MEVNSALDLIKKYNKSKIDDYYNNSKEESPVKHPLEYKTESDFLFCLDRAIKQACVACTPMTLIETSGSSATAFRMVDSNSYIRMPVTPKVDGRLDIDEGLSFGVLYLSLNMLWAGYDDMGSLSDDIFMSYEQAYKDYREDLEDNPNNDDTKTILFRYSADDDDYHDNYQDDDIYISFKNNGVWSAGMQFMGSDGKDGGDGNFTGLDDTPSELKANKLLTTNDDGSAIILTDIVKANPDFDSLTGEYDVEGEIKISLLYDGSSEYKSTHYFCPSDDLKITFKTHTLDEGGDDEHDALEIEIGRKYIMYFFPDSHKISIDFDCGLDTSVYGNQDIDDSKEVVILEFFYDDGDIYILNNISFDSAN